MQHHLVRRVTAKLVPALFVLLFVLSACSSSGGTGSATPTPQLTSTVTQSASNGVTPGATTTTLPAQVDTCPRLIGYPKTGTYCYIPHQLRVAYGVESL